MIPRRKLLQGGVLAGLGLVSGTAAAPVPRVGAQPSSTPAPALVRGGRPQLTHGTQSGDPTADSAVVWARADRPARMIVDICASQDFRHKRTVKGPVLLDDSDFTGIVDLRGLPAGRELFYRVRLEDPDRHGLTGEPRTGRLVTAPSPYQKPKKDVRFVWSADVNGQGWGINPDFDGIRIYDEMRALRPDFFLHSGDSVYADGPIQSQVTLPDGRIWRNLVTEAKSKVAETLAEFRGQWAYNLLSESSRAFAADVPMIGQWDDHEVVNNWYPGEILDDPRYTEQNVDVLARRARRAFFEWTPIRRHGRDPEGRVYRKLSYGPLLDVFVLDMRTYKDANTAGLETVPDGGVLGRRQLRWLTDGLLTSRATWKVIANDLPLGLVVPDGPLIEGVAQGDPGAPRGRELEFAPLLSTLRRHRIRNVVWLTADVHYSAAHHYSPERAAFTDFDPFWEFVAGPLNAGAFGPNTLDPTFGPEARFVHAPPAPNTSPLDGFQHFGEVEISAETGELTVRLRDQSGLQLYTTTLTPRRR